MATRPLALLGLALASSGCVAIGGVSASEFRQEMQHRGGGLSQELVVEAVDAVGRDMDVPVGDLQLECIEVRPGQVDIQVVPPDEDDPETVVEYVYGAGILADEGLDDALWWTTEQPDVPKETRTFSVADARLEQLDALVDRALDQSGLDGGWVHQLEITRSEPSGPVVVAKVTAGTTESNAEVRFPLEAQGSTP